MMHNYFPFGFPYYRMKSPYHYSNYVPQNVLHNVVSSPTKFSYNAYVPNNLAQNNQLQHNCNVIENSTTRKNTINSKKIVDNKNCDNDEDDVLFEIFGFKLHFDDILILFLLFFLYKEEATDTYLYIALVLLLLG